MNNLTGRAPQCRQEVITWVSEHVLPHEADVRTWLRHRGVSQDEIDDTIQEAYCRIAALDHVRHIRSGRHYFLQTARNILFEHLRRARVVRLESMTEIDLSNIVEEEPSPEQITADRRELRRVQELIEGLPEPCRRIFQLKRIEGVSQRNIAALLSITENVVEAHATRGLKRILALLAGDSEVTGGTGTKDEQARKRTRS